MKWPDKKSPWRLALLVSLALVLFHAPYWLIAPFKWFEVFFHEISHGLMALATGGTIERIDIQYVGSGTCYYRGGYQPMVTFFGYTGATLWGWLIYEAGHAGQRKTSVGIISLLLIFISASAALWVRDRETVLIMLAMGAVLALMLKFGGTVIMKFFVEFIGIFILMASIQSPYFLFQDHNRGRGDGEALYGLTQVPVFFWASLWMLLGVAVLLLIVRSALKSSASE